MIDEIQPAIDWIAQLPDMSPSKQMGALVKVVKEVCAILVNNLDPDALEYARAHQGICPVCFVDAVKEELATLVIDLTAGADERLTAVASITLTGSQWSIEQREGETMRQYAHGCCIEIMEEVTVSAHHGMYRRKCEH